MRGSHTPPGVESVGRLADLRLDSWKEIASYLKRSPRTVSRWERQEGLPVRRHQHVKQGTIYAFAHEIERWLRRRAAHSGPCAPGEGTPAGLSPAAAPRHSSTPSTKSIVIAVLPLRSLVGRRREEWFSEGLTYEIISRLGQANPLRLRIIPFSSALAYRQSGKPVEQIGRKLGADFVLEGAVQRSGQRVRLTARLISAPDQAHVWTESFEIQLPPYFFFQQDLARKVADAIALKLGAVPRVKPRAPIRFVGSAHDAFLEGVRHLSWDEGQINKSIECFTQAIERGAGCAAYAELALAYQRLGLFCDHPPAAIFGRVKEFASKALKTDRGSALAYAATAAANLYGSWRWSEAEANTRRALDLNPSSSRARIMGAACHLVAGNLEDAGGELEGALQEDPLSPVVSMACAIYGFYARRYDAALKLCLEAIRRDPSSVTAHLVAASCYAHKTDYPDAVRYSETGRKLCPGKIVPASVLCLVYAVAGRRESAQGLFQKLVQAAEREYARSFWLARAAAGLGSHDLALELLEKAFAQRDPLLVFLKVDPPFEPLLRSPRFRALLDRIGLWR